MVVLRSPFNFDAMENSDLTGLECLDRSLTQQSFADDADINVLVRRFGLDGELPVGVRMPTFGDFTGVGDFQDAIEAVKLASDAFKEMPARVRARFDNDAGKFVEFCSDPANFEEAKGLGLVSAEAAERVAAERKAVEDGRRAELDAAAERVLAAREAAARAVAQ